MDRHLYRAALNGTSPDLAEMQLVEMTTEPGWHETNLSPDGRWFTDKHSDAGTPPTLDLRQTQIGLPADISPTSAGIAASTLRTVKPIRQPETMSITTDDGTLLPAILVRPDSGTTTSGKYPVVIEVYGGPAAPVVSNRWAGPRTLYRELLARRGVATLVVDNRSSASKSMSTTWAIRGKVGEVEFADVQSTVSWLKQQAWVDADRIAIRGWSFGGFLTLYAMTHSKAFVAGIAGGSVTDWAEYDSFYTERYMGMPQENVSGYESTSVVAAAGNLSGRLLMIHGEVDDNVHPSNTLRMASALQKAGKPFQMMIYPGAAHAVTAPKQNWHLVQMTDDFLMDALLD